MLGMSEYQLDLMFEYIELSQISRTHEVPRLAEIRKTLLEDARANEERMSKISANIDKMRADTITFGQR
jgi:hypothetical protein